MRSSARQQGVALIISMILLLVITLIGVAVMGGSRLEWLMANNSHFQSDAAMRADATLRVAESKITGVLGLYNGPWGGRFTMILPRHQLALFHTTRACQPIGAC